MVLFNSGCFGNFPIFLKRVMPFDAEKSSLREGASRSPRSHQDTSLETCIYFPSERFFEPSRTLGEELNTLKSRFALTIPPTEGNAA